jgi:hypothetical protein
MTTEYRSWSACAEHQAIRVRGWDWVVRAVKVKVKVKVKYHADDFVLGIVYRLGHFR